MNRANPALLDYMQYYLDHTDASKGERYRLAKEFGQMLLSNCREAIGTAPLYRDGELFTLLRCRWNQITPLAKCFLRSHLPHGPENYGHFER
jgi:hypothetical protein